MKNNRMGCCMAVCLLLAAGVAGQKSGGLVAGTGKLKSYVSYFNAHDTETVVNFVPNARAFDWLSLNVPLFDCPDSILERTYYYRWWTFRKHLKQTPDGFVFTEFITPVGHAGLYNTVSSALGHHIYEGRWLRDPQYIEQYINFWLTADRRSAKPHLHAFSSWIDDAVYNFYLARPDKPFLQKIVPVLDSDYHQWEQEKLLGDSMFWQFDVRDAMEESISGSRKEKNLRPTINSYMYGNAKALSAMAAITGNASLEKVYAQKAEKIKRLTEKNLWDDTASFFKVKQEKSGALCDAREELGFIPWYFDLPDDNARFAKQWNKLTDSTGFEAPWGITTAERRHPLFRTHGTGHGCEWDGAIWPFATTQTLKGLSNLLTKYKYHANMSPNVFYNELQKYAWAHQKNGQLYLGEYQDEKNGYWLKGDNPRSSYYNHSCFADLIISDLVGLKPRLDNSIEVYPLIPRNKWDWFCLDNVPYHGHVLTILYDKTGKHYRKGKGMQIFVDGRAVHQGESLEHVTVTMPG